jgi:hypothetical protein
MKTIKPTDGAAAAERRLAAWMLNMEHGAVAYGPDLLPLPGPHEPWPLVRLAPLTEKGLPAVAHYRPTVGLVYYTASDRLQVGALVDRLVALLEGLPEDHLKGHRAVAATPATVLRHRGRVLGGNLVIGPRRFYKKPVAEKKDELPARLLIRTPEADLEPPPHYSIRAAFTWGFMPVTAALAIDTLGSMAAFNAVVASLFYDAGLVSKLADGADEHRLTLADFDFPRLPAFLAGADAALEKPDPREARFGPEAHGAMPASAAFGSHGVLLVTPSRHLTFVGNHLCLRARAPPAHSHLPLAAWDPAAVAVRGPGQFQCCACDAPVGGEAILLWNPKSPAVSCHRAWFYLPLPTGTPLLRGDNANRALVLCLFCWGALESASCLSEHMGARLARTVVPHTQAEVCAACPGYSGLAPLLDAWPVRAIAGVAGAFVVTTSLNGPGAGAAVVLASEKLGPYPMLTAPGVASFRLPVVPNLRIAEVHAPRGAQAQAK